MTFALCAQTELCHATHALEICYRCTAEFLDDESQGEHAVPPKIWGVKSLRASPATSGESRPGPAPHQYHFQAQTKAIPSSGELRS